MFRVVLEEYRALCQLRKRLELEIAARLATQPDFVRLQTDQQRGPEVSQVEGQVTAHRHPPVSPSDSGQAEESCSQSS